MEKLGSPISHIFVTLLEDNNSADNAREHSQKMCETQLAVSKEIPEKEVKILQNKNLLLRGTNFKN